LNPSYNHSVRKQTLKFYVDSEEMALSLQSRVSDINRNMFLPVINRVMDEVDPLDKYIKIDKLNIDLGWIPYYDFEDIIEKRLESVLSRVLKKLLNDYYEVNTVDQLDSKSDTNKQKNGNGVSIQNKSDSQFSLFEYYLVNGALPWYSHDHFNFCFETLFLELLKSNSIKLVLLIRKNSYLSQVLTRLVFQLQQNTLNQLLSLLEPNHAALIITYLIDLNKVYVVKPLLVINIQQFNRFLWVLVLSYSANDRGTQFNRQSFIKYLLKGMAQRQHLNYSELLQFLDLGIKHTIKNYSLQSSLPAVIAKLINEQKRLDGIKVNKVDGSDRVSTKKYIFQKKAEISNSNSLLSVNSDNESSNINTIAHIENYLYNGLHYEISNFDIDNNKYDISDFINLINLSDSATSSSIMELIYQLARSSRPGMTLLIERLLNIFTLSDLLTILAVKEKSLIKAWISMLIGSCKQLPVVVSRQNKSSQPLVWGAVLQYLISNSSSAWTIQSMISQTIVFVADKIQISTDILASRLSDMLDAKTNKTIKYALHRVISKINHTFEQSLNSISLIKTTHLLSPKQALQFFQSYDDVDIIRFYLRYGILPWQILQYHTELTGETFIAGLLKLPETRLRALLRFDNKTTQLIALHRLTTKLPEKSILELIKQVLPQEFIHKENILESISLSVPNIKYKEIFYSHLIASIIHDEKLDLEELKIIDTIPVNVTLVRSIKLWDCNELQSEFIRRLHHVPHFNEKLPSSVEILNELITRYASDAKMLVLSLYETPDLVNEMLQQSNHVTFTHLLVLMQPNEHSILQALMESLQTIPMPYRPDINILRQTILKESINFEHPVGEDFFIRVLSKIFKGSMSRTLKNHLLNSVELWSEVGRIPDLVISNYKTAIDHFSGTSENDINSGFIYSSPGLMLNSKGHSIVNFSTGLEDYQQQIFIYLSGGNITDESATQQYEYKFSSLSKQQQKYLIIKLFEQSPLTLTLFIKKHILDHKVREFWIANLSESLLSRIIWLLEPQQLSPLLDVAEILSLALYRAVPESRSKLSMRNEFWCFMLQIFSYNNSNYNLRKMTIDFIKYFSLNRLAQFDRSIDLWSKQRERENLQLEVVSEAFFDNASLLAQKYGKNKLLDVLQQERRNLIKLWKNEQDLQYQDEANLKNLSQDMRAKPLEKKLMLQANTGDLSFYTSIYNGKNGYKEESNYNGESIYINNAGLILVGVFLPHLFKSLDMLVTDKDGKVRLRDPATFSRGVHILQYLVDASSSSPEPVLVLNKILCGEPPSTPVEQMIELRANELEICNTLHQALLSKWESLSSTSVEGLQQTFLQREGRLYKNNDGWKLTVQRKTVDVLVDQVPWRTSIISEAWMTQPIYVNW